ncbi:MAG: sugar phosphate isomerase/epimerase [Acidobacteriota bacterium]|nr:sugar phosphate isomerase/epimerase [Acidobacteriota bacterium]
MNVTRRAALALLAETLLRAATRLPANKNVKWALGSNLWNYFPRVPFTDILDVMKDTGFIGVRVTQFPKILETYSISAAQMKAEAEKRGLRIITISFNGPAHDPAQTGDFLANAKIAMNFLKGFDANLLVVFSPNRSNLSEAGFKTMCETYNKLGEVAGGMGFRAGLHNHLGQMVQNQDEVERCMAMTDPKLFWFSPDTAHLYLAGCDPKSNLDRYRGRLMMMDYKDAKKAPEPKFQDRIFDLGDGEIDFPGCHRVLKSMNYKGWICVDLDIARQGPRVSYQRCGAYITDKLEPIYS